MMLASRLGCPLNLKTASLEIPDKIVPRLLYTPAGGRTNVEICRPVDTVAAPLDILKSRFGL